MVKSTLAPGKTPARSTPANPKPQKQAHRQEDRKLFGEREVAFIDESKLPTRTPERETALQGKYELRDRLTRKYDESSAAAGLHQAHVVFKDSKKKYEPLTSAQTKIAERKAKRFYDDAGHWIMKDRDGLKNVALMCRNDINNAALFRSGDHEDKKYLKLLDKRISEHPLYGLKGPTNEFVLGNEALVDIAKATLLEFARTRQAAHPAAHAVPVPVVANPALAPSHEEASESSWGSEEDVTEATKLLNDLTHLKEPELRQTYAEKCLEIRDNLHPVEQRKQKIALFKLAEAAKNGNPSLDIEDTHIKSIRETPNHKLNKTRPVTNDILLGELDTIGAFLKAAISHNAPRDSYSA